jgi:hypothetical protein
VAVAKGGASREFPMCWKMQINITLKAMLGEIDAK